jgi:RsiW-degrading membrane proteinase PrsW (M82 family)
MDEMTAWLVSIAAAVIPTIVYVLILWWLDHYEKEPKRLLLAAFLWGAIPAVLLSVFAEVVLEVPLGGVGENAIELMSSSILAPFVEEIVKGLALLGIFLLFRREFDNVLDGIIYGATVGFGFAMTENIFYFLNSLRTSGVEGLTLTYRPQVKHFNNLSSIAWECVVA